MCGKSYFIAVLRDFLDVYYFEKRVISIFAIIFRKILMHSYTAKVVVFCCTNNIAQVCKAETYYRPS